MFTSSSARPVLKQTPQACIATLLAAVLAAVFAAVFTTAPSAAIPAEAVQIILLPFTGFL